MERTDASRWRSGEHNATRPMNMASPTRTGEKEENSQYLPRHMPHADNHTGLLSTLDSKV